MFAGYLFLRFKDGREIHRINPSKTLMNLQYPKFRYIWRTFYINLCTCIITYNDITLHYCMFIVVERCVFYCLQIQGIPVSSTI